MKTGALMFTEPVAANSVFGKGFCIEQQQQQRDQ